MIMAAVIVINCYGPRKFHFFASLQHKFECSGALMECLAKKFGSLIGCHWKLNVKVTRCFGPYQGPWGNYTTYSTKNKLFRWYVGSTKSIVRVGC